MSAGHVANWGSLKFCHPIKYSVQSSLLIGASLSEPHSSVACSAEVSVLLLLL